MQRVSGVTANQLFVHSAPVYPYTLAASMPLLALLFGLATSFLVTQSTWLLTSCCLPIVYLALFAHSCGVSVQLVPGARTTRWRPSGAT